MAPKNPNDILLHNQSTFVPTPTTTSKPRNKGVRSRPGRGPSGLSGSKTNYGIKVRAKADPAATAALFGAGPLSNMIFNMLGGKPSGAVTAAYQPVGPASASGVYRAEGSTYGTPTAAAGGAGGDESQNPSTPGTMTALRRYMDFASRNPRDVIKELMDTAGIEAGVRSAIDSEVGKLSAAADAIRNMQAAARPGLQSVVSGAQQQTQATVQQLRQNQAAAQQAATADEATRAQMYANTPGLEGVAPQPSNLRASLNADADTARINEAMLRGSDQQAAAQNAMSRYDQTAAGIAGGYQAGIGAVKASEGKVREDLTRQERINAMKLYEIQSNQLGSLAQIESDTNTAAQNAQGMNDWQKFQAGRDLEDLQGIRRGNELEGAGFGEQFASRFLKYVGAKTSNAAAEGAWDLAVGDWVDAAAAGDMEAAGMLGVLTTMRNAFDTGSGSAEKRFQQAINAGYTAGLGLKGFDWQQEGANAYLAALQSVRYPGRRGSSSKPKSEPTSSRSSSNRTPPRPNTAGRTTPANTRSRLQRVNSGPTIDKQGRPLYDSNGERIYYGNDRRRQQRQ